ncbi:hypothetical protein [Streptomyces griseoluteus]|nr:hypothetical protein [Streptomyces griseoluteus]GHF33561.1 hypothetical protein GCM10017776_60080 [Streptomyces griseoluteus]
MSGWQQDQVEAAVKAELEPRHRPKGHPQMKISRKAHPPLPAG